MLRWVVLAVILGIASAVVPDSSRYSTPHTDYVVPRNITPLCLSHTTHWISQLRQGELWALKMLDAWTKLPSGIQIGCTNHFGNYEECVSIFVEDNEASFKGQYFRAWSRIEYPGSGIDIVDMVNAFCIPSTCSPEETQQLMVDIVGPALGFNVFVHAINPLDFHIKNPPSLLPTGALIYVIVTGILAALVVVTAIAEWRLGEKTPALVRACSLTSTCRSLFNIRKHPADISCLHGLRVGSMFWIILGHHYTAERYMIVSNPDLFDAEYFANPLLMTIANAMPSVDTFFLLSGLLMCTSFMREVHKRKHFDLIQFYIYRYLRIAIPMGTIILLYITILPLIGDGPLWNNTFINDSKGCKANWWTNLVFVNNYIYQPGFWGCMGQCWYTAVDMQLAWLSPLVLLPLYHSPRAGLQLMALLILMACFIPFTLTYVYHFPMTLLQIGIDIPMEGVPEGGNMQTMIYNGTQSRAAPYLSGILFGYYFYNQHNKKVNLPKILVCLGWMVNTAMALTIIYSVSVVYQPGYVYDLVGSAFYAGFHRLGWGIVIIWIVFACSNGFGGVVDHILSCRLFLPVSRLTYSAFLVHFIVMNYDAATTRTVSYFSDFDSVHDFCGDLILVYTMAFILYILIEGPLMSLLRVAFSKGRPAAPKLEEKNEIKL